MNRLLKLVMRHAEAIERCGFGSGYCDAGLPKSAGSPVTLRRLGEAMPAAR